MPNILIAKATAALKASVASIIDCDESDATKREALVETFAQFQAFIEHNGGGDDIAKAHQHRGPHELAASLVQHLHDRLDRHRERHGYTKSAKETSPMTALEDIAKSHGVAGVVQIAKNITNAEKSYSLTEEEFVRLIDTAARVTHPELGALAFEKVYERNPVLASAIAVIKAGLAEQLLSGGMPVQVGRDGSQHTKADRGTAYGDLMEKAEEYRNAHPELSIAQAFERVFTAPANRELAKRERVESR